MRDPYFYALTGWIAALFKLLLLGAAVLAIAAVALIPALAHQPIPVKFLVTGVAGMVLWVIAWRLFQVALYWVARAFFFVFRDLPLRALRRAHASFQRRA